MNILLPLVAGVLVACATYLLLSRNLVRLVFGLALLSNAANLALFVAGGLHRAVPPVVPDGASVLPGDAANPLAQALILTAVVIGLGVLTFAFVLTYRAYQELGTLDTAAMRDAEPPEGDS